MAHSGHAPLALVILSGGGFSFETKRILNAIAGSVEFIYLTTEFGGTPGKDGVPDGEAHVVPSFGSVTRKSMRRSAHAFLRTLASSLGILKRKRIDLVIAVGCSHAVPMLLAGRVRGRPTVFIESITRVDRLSNTGKLVYYLRLATIYVIQWPDLQKRYPASRLGTIL